MTWEQFKEYFRGAHIPYSVMKMKKRESEDLKKQGTMVTQYLDQFTQLSRYANDEYMTEDKRMEKFLDGLVPSLKCQLVVHTFPDFKTLVDKAIILENEHRNINEIRKRHTTQLEQVRNNRPRNDFQRPVAPRPPIPAPRPQQSHSFFHNKTKDTTFRPGITCFTCGEKGHYARQCPKQGNKNVPKPNNNGRSINAAPRHKTPTTTRGRDR